MARLTPVPSVSVVEAEGLGPSLVLLMLLGLRQYPKGFALRRAALPDGSIERLQVGSPFAYNHLCY